MSALLPCPFCGSHSVITDGGGDDIRKARWFAFCTDCGGTTRDQDTLDEVFEAWNRRAAPTPALLRSLAEWFDNPNESPTVVVDMQRFGGKRCTPGFLLRLIAEALERAGDDG